MGSRRSCTGPDPSVTGKAGDKKYHSGCARNDEQERDQEKAGRTGRRQCVQAAEEEERGLGESGAWQSYLGKGTGGREGGVTHRNGGARKIVMEHKCENVEKFVGKSVGFDRGGRVFFALLIAI